MSLNIDPRIIHDAKKSFFVNGWAVIDPSILDISEDDSTQILKIREDNYIKNKKNAGNFSLKQDSIISCGHFAKLATNLKIYEFIEEVTGRRAFLDCFMHMLTKGKTPPLGWHRDSYCRNKKFIGPIPQVIKMMIVHTSSSIKDGPFSVVSGSHALDLGDKYIDKLLPYVFNLKKKVFVSSKRLCVIFDGRILHKRLNSHFDGFRSATIISTLPSCLNKKELLKDKNKLLALHMDKRLKV